MISFELRFLKFIVSLIAITFPNIAPVLNFNCYHSFLDSILDMPRKKSKKKSMPKIIETKDEQNTTPRNAKIVLLVFGIGPLILMSLFLFSNGFFNSP